MRYRLRMQSSISVCDAGTLFHLCPKIAFIAPVGTFPLMSMQGVGANDETLLRILQVTRPSR